MYNLFFFFFNDTATTEIYTLSLHDALPDLLHARYGKRVKFVGIAVSVNQSPALVKRYVQRHKMPGDQLYDRRGNRSEEHTSELQSRQYLVCRLLLEKKNTNKNM